MLRAAGRCEENYQAIVKRVQQSQWIVPDETGWRIGGWLAWLHVAATQDAVAYLIAHARGIEASALLIGETIMRSEDIATAVKVLAGEYI